MRARKLANFSFNKGNRLAQSMAGTSNHDRGMPVSAIRKSYIAGKS